MTSIALITLPLTIASTVLQEEARKESLDHQRAVADQQKKTNEKKQAIAQKQITQEATIQKRQLLAQQKALRDSLTANYYKSGIDPTAGSAKNALSSLSQRGADDLRQLAQSTSLRQENAAVGGNDFGRYVPEYNALPATADLLNSIGSDLASFKRNNDNSL